MDQEFVGEAKATLVDHGHRIHNNSLRITVLEGNQKELTKLSTLMELQLDLNKKQSQQLSEQHETLVIMNDTLTAINKSYEKLDGRVEKLESYNSDKKIDLGKFFKDLLLKVIPSVIIGYLLFKFGWK